jgi:hypothetical protein
MESDNIAACIVKNFITIVYHVYIATEQAYSCSLIKFWRSPQYRWRFFIKMIDKIAIEANNISIVVAHNTGIAIVKSGFIWDFG